MLLDPVIDQPISDQWLGRDAGMEIEVEPRWKGYFIGIQRDRKDPWMFLRPRAFCIHDMLIDQIEIGDQRQHEPIFLYDSGRSKKFPVPYQVIIRAFDG